MSAIPAGFADVIRNRRRVLIASHTNPDGDAVGASAALGWLLRALGKDVILYNSTGYPATLSWVCLPSPVVTRAADLPGDPDLVIALDSSDLQRLGDDIRELFLRTPSLVIDHHLGNSKFGSEGNWVEPSRSSVGEMIALLARHMGVPLAGPLAEAAYLAMITDTGAFAYSGTSPETLRLCAEMMENGLNVPQVRDNIEKNWTETRMRLWGEMFREAQILEKGKLAVFIVTRDLLERFHATREDTEGMVEQLRRIRGVRVALLLTELESGQEDKTKASLRSSGRDDVQAVAFQFGGGGHKNAAGASLPLTPERALHMMLPYISHIWSKDEYKKSMSCTPQRI